jgi:hypothetical protein
MHVHCQRVVGGRGVTARRAGAPVLHGPAAIRYHARARGRDAMTGATTEDRPVVLDRAAAPVLTLCIVYSGEAVVLPPEVHTPGRGATPIGRQVERGISLPADRRASRHHATLHAGPMGSLRLVDEQSRNGSFVNGRRVGEALLADGDVVAIGDSYLVVRAVPRGGRDAAVPTLLGASPAIRAARAALAEAAPTTATVLLQADSGCGKEVAARAVHELSRREGAFVAVNCSAIPESLAESQLFGQVAGAFTGAVNRPGLFRAAHGGTLFLDELGELPAAIQPKLLRVLEERAVVPVGATAPLPVDVRIVAATNRELSAAIAEHRFRGDLYARLAQYEVRLPRLRERREDILLLLVHALGERPPRLTPELAHALLLHGWPYNVREVLAVAQQLRIRGSGAAPLGLELVAERLDGGALGEAAAERTGEARGEAAPRVDPAGDDEGDEAGGDGEVPDRAGLEEIGRAHV